MKKRVVSVLLIIALLVAVGIVSAQAATPEEIIAVAKGMDFSGDTGAGVVSYCPACGADKTWTALTAAGGDPGVAGHFYVPNGGVVLNSRIVTGPNDSATRTYCIHLNGQTLTGGGTSGSTIFQRNKATLNILDSEGGKIVGYSGATEGVITGRSSTINIYGGTIAPADGSTYPAIMMEAGTINVYGGTIDGEITMSGAGTVGLNGGAVSKVTPAVSTATINVSGAPTVGTLDLTTSSGLVTVGEMINGASIGVVANTGVFTTGGAAAYENYFSAQAPNEITVSGEELAYSEPDWSTPEKQLAAANAMDFSGTLPTYCPACKATSGVTWTALTLDANNKPGQLTGHYYLDRSLAMAEHITVGKSNGQDLCLHLNGNEITGGSTGNNGCGAFNVRDTSDLNVMAGNGGAINTGYEYMLSNNGTGIVSLYGGTYSANNAVIRMFTGSGITVKLYDTTINGTAVAQREGTLEVVGGSIKTIDIMDTTATVNLSGETTVDTLQLVSGAKLGTVALTGDASVGVVGTAGEAFTAIGMSAQKDFFHAVMPNEIAVGNDGELIYQAVDLSNLTDAQKIEMANEMDFSDANNLPTYCPVCGTTDVTWTALTSDGGTLDPRSYTHYYVSGDGTTLTIGSRFVTGGWVGLKGTYCINLNGNTITGGNAGSTIYQRSDSTLNIMGDGAIIGYNGATELITGNGSTINIYGGTYSAYEGSATSFVTNTGTLRVYGGTVNNEIVNSTGTLAINSGTITKVSATDPAGTVNLSGAPTIGTLDLTSGAVISTITDFEPTAPVNVLAQENSYITAGDAAAYVSYFTTEAPNTIVVKENKLYCQGLSWDTVEQKIAAANEMNFSDPNNLPDYCPICNLTSGVTWTAFGSGTSGEIGNHMYLSESFSADGNKTVGKVNNQTVNACLHLNGKTLSGGNSSSGLVSMRGVTLNVMGSGSLNADYYVFRVQNACEINIYGGEHTTATAEGYAARFAGTSGIFNVYGGTISRSIRMYNETNFAISSGTVNIKGGNVSDITTNAGTVNIEKGTVLTATNSGATATVSGGNVTTLNANSGTTGITGGTVTTANVAGGTFNLSGAPTIGTLDLTSGGVISTITDFEPTATISVLAEENTYITAGDAAAYVSCFAAQSPNSVIVDAENGNKLYYKGISWDTIEQKIEAANAMDFSDANNLPDYCPVCNITSGVTWQAMPTATQNLNGHYYVNTDAISVTGNYTVGTGNAGQMTACIHFNGYTINGGGGNGTFNFRTGSTMNLMGATGGITYNGGSIFFNNNGATDPEYLNIYGGTYTTDNNVVVMNQPGMNATVYAGTLNGTVWAKNGGSVVIEDGTVKTIALTANDATTVTVNGGNVTTLTAATGTTNIQGGTVTTATVTGGALNLSGDPTITTLDLSSGAVISTITDFEPTAPINVLAQENSYITAGDAAAYVSYFTTEAPNTIVVKENKLYCQGLSWETLEEKIAAANAMDFSDPNNLPDYCPVCNITSGVTWTAFGSGTSGEIGNHMYLSETFSTSGNKTVGKVNNQTVNACLHLNGKTLSGGDGNGLISMRGVTLNVMGNGSLNANNYLYRVQNACTINIYGGEHTTATAEGYAARFAGTSGIFNVYGGTISRSIRMYNETNFAISSGTVNIKGGNVSDITTNAGTVNIEKGTVLTATNSGATATVSGGNVTTLNANSGTTGITGGTVTTANVGGGTFNLSGAPTIGTLDLTSGGVISTITDFEPTATISVLAEENTYITAGDAAAYVSCFAAQSPNSVIVDAENGNKLYYKGISWDTIEQKIEAANAMDFSDPSNLPDYCPICNKSSGVTWQAMPTATQNLNGHYYVNTDAISVTGNYTVGTGNAGQMTACIHFNGYTINGGGNVGTFNFRTGSTMNLMGASGGITYNGGSIFFNNSGATDPDYLNIYGGTYTTDNNVVVMNQPGMNVTVYAGTLNGTIWAKNGGNVVIEDGSVETISLTNNTVGTAATTVTVNGGNVTTLTAATGTTNIQGGTVTTATVTGGALNLSGDPTITTLDLTSGTKATVGTLTGGGIGIKANGVFTNDIADVNAAKTYFTPVEAGYTINISGNTLSCDRPSVEPEDVYAEVQKWATEYDFAAGNTPDYCPACNKAVTSWTALTDVTSDFQQMNGHYYVPEGGLTISKNYTTAASSTVCVYLNGQTLAGGSSDSGVFSVRTCTLNVMGDGTVNGAETGIRVFNAQNSANIRIFGGTYKTEMAGSSAVFFNAACTVELYKGTITGVRNAVYIQGAGSFVMHDGTLNGGIAAVTSAVGATIKNGTVNGGINMSVGALDIQGGTFDTVDVEANATITLSGAPTITTLDLISGVKATLGELTTGARIGVVASGAFTDVLANAEAVKGYFTAEMPYSVVAEGNVLYCRIKTWDTAEEIIADANAMDFDTNTYNYCPACGASGVTWVELTNEVVEAQSVSPYGIKGHYYVGADTLDIGSLHITGGKADNDTLCIHMNENTITGGNGNGIFSMRTATLNIIGNGQMIGGASASRALNPNSGTVNIYGGTYTVTGDGDSPVYVKGTGTVNLYAGTIDGAVDGGESAFAVYLNAGATFNMEGGSVIGARIYADDAGAVKNTVTIKAGTVSGGLGVALSDLTVTGGTINQIDVASDATVAISGKPVITLLNLPDDFQITVGELVSGAVITVSADGVFTTDFASVAAAETAMGFFLPADDGRIEVEGFALKFVGLTIYEKAVAMDFTTSQVHDCPACGEKGVTWTALTNASGQQLKGHYYVADETVDLGANHITVGTANGQTLCVNLNGKTIAGGNGDGIFSMRTCVLNLMGDGNVTGGASAGRVFNTNTGTINLYGGTYSATKAAARTVWSEGAGTVTLHAGTINGLSDGYAVYLNNGATFNMEGGEVAGARLYSNNNPSQNVPNPAANNITINAGTVEHLGVVLCSLNINGGTIGQVDTASEGVEIVLAGDPTITVLAISSEEANPAITVNDDFAGTVYLRNPVLDADITDITTRHGYEILGAVSEGSFTGNVYATFPTVSDANTYVVLPTTDGLLQIASTSVVNGETEAWYVDTASAVAAANGTSSYVKLYTSEPVVLEENDDIVLDLNGQFVSITGSGAFTGFDSATDEFAVGGSALVDGVTVKNTTSDNVNGKNYITLVVDDATSFNYYEMKLSGIAIKPTTAGLYYKATWSTNSHLKANMDAGVVVSLIDVPTSNFVQENTDSVASSGKYVNFYHSYAGTTITNGVAKTSVLVNGIMKTTNDPSKNVSNGQKKIHAAAYITVNGENIVTNGISMSILDVLTALDSSEALYNANVEALTTFFNTWKNYMPAESWLYSFTRIGKDA